MTSLEDIADDTGDVYLARNCEGMAFRLGSRETVPCTEIGTDEYPQYGDFLPVETWHPPTESWVEDCYLEATVQLAKTILDLGLDEGDTFKVTDVNQQNGQYWFVLDTDW